MKMKLNSTTTTTNPLISLEHKRFLSLSLLFPPFLACFCTTRSPIFPLFLLQLSDFIFDFVVIFCLVLILILIFRIFNFEHSRAIFVCVFVLILCKNGFNFGFPDVILCRFLVLVLAIDEM